jgi:hypothetical protein
MGRCSNEAGASLQKREEVRVFVLRKELSGVWVLLLLLVDMSLEALGSFVVIVVFRMAGLGFVVPGKSWACKRGQEQNCRKQSLHEKDRITPIGCRLNRIAGLVHKEQSGDCSGPKSAPSPGRALRGVVVMVVVVMVVASSKSCRAGENHQKQNYRENLFHGTHPSRTEFVTEAPCGTSNQKRN